MAITNWLAWYWKLWNDANNSLGVLNGTPTGSVSYDGQKATFSAANISVGNIAISTGFTICFWLFLTAFTNDWWLISKRDWTTGNAFQIAQSWTATDGQLLVYLWNTAFGNTSSGTGFLILNQWIHVGVTFDGTNVVYFKNWEPFISTVDVGNIVTTSLSTRFMDDWFAHQSTWSMRDVYIATEPRTAPEIKMIKELSYPLTIQFNWNA